MEGIYKLAETSFTEGFYSNSLSVYVGAYSRKAIKEGNYLMLSSVWII